MKAKEVYMDCSDVELLRLSASDDGAAYTELYQRYHGVCIAFAYKKLQDEELAKDVVQEIFLKLWDCRKSIDVRFNLAGYLMTSIKHKMFSMFEHQAVCARYVESFSGYVNSGNAGHADYLLRERDYERHVDQAIEALPSKMKAAFLLSRKHYLSYQETAKQLNTTPNNVQKHINGALKILKGKLTLFV